MHQKHCCNTLIHSNCFQKKCGTLNTEFVPCIQKEIPDQIFYDCCKLYVESAECHELCRYGTNRDVAQSFIYNSV
ncbi:hypothetical protein ACO02O_01113 [Dirofilaria immitis]